MSACRIEKRLRRLQQRTRRKLLELEPNSAVEFVEEPSRFLFVGNGGLECGVDHTTLQRFFSEYGMVKKIVMELHRPYAFVEMNDIVEKATFKIMDGKSLEPLMTSPPAAIHLSYVTHLPEKIDSTSKVVPNTCTLPPGLHFILDFVNDDEEATLLAAVASTSDEQSNHSTKDVSGSLLKHRRVRHYGYEFIYGSNDIDLSKRLESKIPSMCDFLIERMIMRGCVTRKPDQLTVNEYESGQGIPPHIDTHSAFEDGIVSLSLGSQAVMEFSHPIHPKCTILLSRRSLLVMTRECRYEWTHGIPSRKSDVVDASVFTMYGIKHEEPVIQQRGKRVSLTFRTVRGKPCCCDFPAFCDRTSYRQQKQPTETALFSDVESTHLCLT